MNHAYIAEHDVAERYILGQLPPEEAEAFEEHYLSCQECLDRLELAESMERGFKRAAGQDAARAAVRQVAVVAWLSRLGRSRQMATLLMGVLVLLLVPGVFTVRRLGHLDRELADTRSALAREREAASDRGSEAQALRSDLEATSGELERERQVRARAEEQLAEAWKPRGNIHVIPLDRERGSASEPTVQIPRALGAVVFQLPIDPPHPPSYLAVVRDARGREVERLGGLTPDGTDSLTMWLPLTRLAPGDYAITVSAGGKPVPAGRFAFRVLGP